MLLNLSDANYQNFENNILLTAKLKNFEYYS